MKVLILTLSTGQGHKQTSRAIAGYLNDCKVENKILDVYKYISPLLSDSVEKGYLLGASRMPHLYGKIYRREEINDEKERRRVLYKIFSDIAGSKFIKFVNEYNPDVVVSTHVFAAMMMTYLKNKITAVKNIGVVTDFTVHPFWRCTDLDYYVSASELLTHVFTKRGIAKEKILPFGIPIETKFASSIPKEDARKLLKIDNLDTVMIMMGSMGFGNVAKIVKQIDMLDFEFQILCVCGNNQKALYKVQNMENTKHKIWGYGFVDNVDVMMDASDFIVTKPGGLSISESLAKGLPMVLVNPIPGQENRNMEFLINNGLAAMVTPTYPIDDAIYQMLSNKLRRQHIKSEVQYIGKPNSTKVLCEFITEIGGK